MIRTSQRKLLQRSKRVASRPTGFDGRDRFNGCKWFSKNADDTRLQKS